MLNILLIFHILLLCLIIIFILLNKGKGSEIGTTFNSSNINFMNAKESSSLIKKIIVILSLISLLSMSLINITNKNYKNNQEKPIIKLLDK